MCAGLSERFYFHFPNDLMCVCPFMCLLPISISSLGKCPNLLTTFSFGWFCHSAPRALYAGCKALVGYATCRYFVPVCGVSSLCLTISCEEHKFLILMIVVSVCSFTACVFGVISKKPWPNPRSQRFSSMFSSRGV